MWTRRLTLADLPQSLGTFKPVGHVMVALPDDDAARQAAQALRDEGFDAEDILHFDSDEGATRMRDMIAHSSGAAGFGYEITLMRRYQALSDEGHRWLLVYAPDDEETERVKGVAARLGAPMAVKYHRLAVEDLL
jgi:hypothetical protein